MNAKISRVVRQVLEQKERKHTDERWSTWLRESETEVSVLAGGSHSLVNNSGVVSISAGAESQESGSSFQGRVAHGRDASRGWMSRRPSDCGLCVPSGLRHMSIPTEKVNCSVNLGSVLGVSLQASSGTCLSPDIAVAP